MKWKMLFLALDRPPAHLWSPAFLEALREFGEVELHEQTAGWSQDKTAEVCRCADVVFGGWAGRPLPISLADEPGRLRYICFLTGTMRDQVPVELIRSVIPVTNWGDAPAGAVAEGAVALLLGCLKNLRHHTEIKRDGGWVDPTWRRSQGSLEGLRLGLYGFGVIARKFVEMVRPFGPQISLFDPYAQQIPPDIQRVDSLTELFRCSEAISVHAPLNDVTRGSIQSAHLALLPDQGIIVNTARGAIFDESALFAELRSGRLRAGLDVLSTDENPLSSDHPLRQCPNVILTAHQVSAVLWPVDQGTRLQPLHQVALDNLRRFAQGQPLRFQMDEARYALST